MRAVDVDENLAFADKVPRWRLSELIRLFPTMPIERAEELAIRGDYEMLPRARRLAADGCPAELAYLILR